MVKLPIEYKKRFVKFLGCEIDLSKRPFIPRIETEYWVKKAINEIKKSGAKGQKLEVLDVLNLIKVKVLDIQENMLDEK